MESIAQIIAAMMNMQPQVTSMGAAPGGGGGGVNVPAVQAGGGLSMGGRRQQKPMPQMPQVDAPFQGGTPTTGGVPLRPSEGGYQKATRPQDTTAPDNTPLIRQAFEAQQDLMKYQNPQTITDAWNARKELPKARERYMQAQKNIQDYNAAQASMRLKANVMQIEGMATGIFGKDRAAQVADFAYNNPDAIPEIQKQLAETAEAQRVEKREDVKQVETAEFKKDSLLKLNVPESIANTLSRQSDMTASDLQKMYFENQDRAIELHEKIVKENAGVRDQIFEIDNMIDVTETALADTGYLTTGVGGAILQWLPGTPAANLKESTSTLKANLAFKRLFDMRQASTTGGALGNVSNQEIKLLHDSWRSLSLNQSDDQMRENLNAVLVKYARVKYLLELDAQGKLDGVSGIEQARMADEYIAKQNGTPLVDPERVKSLQSKYGTGAP